MKDMIKVVFGALGLYGIYALGRRDGIKQSAKVYSILSELMKKDEADTADEEVEES